MAFETSRTLGKRGTTGMTKAKGKLWNFFFLRITWKLFGIAWASTNWWGEKDGQKPIQYPRKSITVFKTFLQIGDKKYYYHLGMKEGLPCYPPINKGWLQGGAMSSTQMSHGGRVGSSPSTTTILRPRYCHLTLPGFRAGNSQIKVLDYERAKFPSFSNVWAPSGCFKS